MAGAPKVTATFDKAEYPQGATATLTFAVEADTYDIVENRVAVAHGHDDEGNDVEVRVTTKVRKTLSDSFTLTSVVWEDTGEAFAISGLKATAKA